MKALESIQEVHPLEVLLLHDEQPHIRRRVYRFAEEELLSQEGTMMKVSEQLLMHSF